MIQQHPKANTNFSKQFSQTCKTDLLSAGSNVITIPQNVTVQKIGGQNTAPRLVFEGPLGSSTLDLAIFLPWVDVILVRHVGRVTQLRISPRPLMALLTPQSSIFLSVPARARTENHVVDVSEPEVFLKTSDSCVAFQPSCSTSKGTVELDDARYNRNSKVCVKRHVFSGRKNALQTTLASQIRRILHGLEYGFLIQLETRGVGYRVAILETLDKQVVVQLKVGFCHDVEILVPAGIQVFSNRATVLHLWGVDYKLVRQFAATIRNVRSPENYQGKGIRWSDEHVELKPGKKK